MSASEARAAYEAVQPKLETISKDQLVPIRVDVQAAAAVAHSIGVRDALPERRSAFERLAKAGHFDIDALDSLPRVALAAWHARQQQLLAAGSASDATLPLAVINDAQALRKRMLRVLDYYFEDDVEFGPQLGVVRAGTGHQDLANDLEALADLYEHGTIAPLIGRDPKYFRADDPKGARAFAAAIFRGLGLASTVRGFDEATQRAWTLLSRGYDKVRRAGQYIFADAEDVELTYPSLVAYVRAPAVRRVEPEPGEAGVSTEKQILVSSGG